MYITINKIYLSTYIIAELVHRFATLICISSSNIENIAIVEGCMDCKTAREMNFDSLTARILLTCRQSVFVVCWLVCDWIMTACSLVSLCSASSLRSAEMTGDTDARRERSSRTSNSEAADSTDVDIPPG